MFSLSKIVSWALIHYHANMVDITNCLGQLHLISMDEWEERNKKHVMALIMNPQINTKGMFIHDEEKRS